MKNSVLMRSINTLYFRQNISLILKLTSGQRKINKIALLEIFSSKKIRYYWGHKKLGRCAIQLSKFLNHTLATHNQVDSFFENINHNDGKGAFTLTLFEMTIADCPGFHVPHCILRKTILSAIFITRSVILFFVSARFFFEKKNYE
jgi:hypothetical protein